MGRAACMQSWQGGAGGVLHLNMSPLTLRLPLPATRPESRFGIVLITPRTTHTHARMHGRTHAHTHMHKYMHAHTHA